MKDLVRRQNDDFRQLVALLREDAASHREAWLEDNSGSLITEALLKQAADAIERLSAPAEPVATVTVGDGASGVDGVAWIGRRYPLGTALYAHPAAPAPEAATIDQIMALADTYGLSRYAMGADEGNPQYSADCYVSLRAAVERVVQERDKAEKMLLATKSEREARAEAERDALKGLLREARLYVEDVWTGKDDQTKDLLARIDAAIQEQK